jgi:S-adenosylmethionine synthetase
MVVHPAEEFVLFLLSAPESLSPSTYQGRQMVRLDHLASVIAIYDATQIFLVGLCQRCHIQVYWTDGQCKCVYSYNGFSC